MLIGNQFGVSYHILLDASASQFSKMSDNIATFNLREYHLDRRVMSKGKISVAAWIFQKNGAKAKKLRMGCFLLVHVVNYSGHEKHETYFDHYQTLNRLQHSRTLPRKVK